MNISQIIRYGVTGSFINGGGYLVYLFLLSIGMNYIIATSLLYACGTAISFLLNRKFVFNSNIPIASSFRRYLLMILIGYFMNILTLFVLVDAFDYNPKYAQIISILIASLYFYLFGKIIVYKVN